MNVSTMNDRSDGRGARVAVVGGGAEADRVGGALAAAGHRVLRYAGAGDAALAWRTGTCAYPDAAWIALGEPLLAEAVRVLRGSLPLPVLLGLYRKGEIGDAVALLREGFYDALELPASEDAARRLLDEALEARAECLRARTTGREALPGLLALAAERRSAPAAAVALALLAPAGAPLALVAGGRAYPGGDAYAPPAEAWQEIGATGRATLTGGELPPALAGLACGEAELLAPGILLVRGGLDNRPVDEHARLVGAILAHVVEGESHVAQALGPGPRERLERLARLGESALSLNHDLNNPLCAIALNAQLLSLALRGSGAPKLEERARAIEENAAKMQQIVRRLVQAKPERTEPAAATSGAA